ncbi:MAG: hypothetical protein M1815_005320 [Lichina confinis]|nr:MAG: hypothetical protein M1815_005320 [Lichina confinis]
MAMPTTITTVLVPNLHCSSCVSTIESALSPLSPSPTSISVSIVCHSITLAHDLSLSASAIRKALEETGFDVYDVFQQAPADSVVRAASDNDFERAVKDWDGNRIPVDAADAARLRSHVESCEACRATFSGGSYATLARRATDSERSSQDDENSDVKDELAVDGEVRQHEDDNAFLAVKAGGPSKPARVELSISGMTCGTCTGKITNALESKPWVRSANVSFLTTSASVVVEGKKHVDELVAAVAELGYEAEATSAEEIDVTGKPGWRQGKDVWTATYSVDGMTCSSCVATITRALQQKDWVKSADVDLVSNSATVTFRGKDRVRDVEEIIGDVGYDATLHRVVDVSMPAGAEGERRVSLRVDGLHCSQCPERIAAALRNLEGGVVVERLPCPTDPILKIRYRPHPPQLSLRRVTDTISAIDPAFRVSVHHEPSLEERSQQMYARDRQRLAMRLALAVAVAVPSFIIGIVFMSLVSSEHPARTYLMEPAWVGSVSRAEWALFILATPVYFFAADVFHHRTIKELRGLWGPASKTPILRRFYRFGSMDMLISFGTSIAYFASVAEIGIAASRSSAHGAMHKRFTYFDSVVFLTMFLLMGRLLEAYSKAKTGNAVATLGKLRPSEAILLESMPVQAGSETEPNVSDASAVPSGKGSHDEASHGGALRETARTVPVDMLEVGDVIKVVQGASPPLDGVVVGGEASFDESSMTGESRLIPKTVGDEVYSGTVNREGPIRVRVVSGVGQSMLDKIIQAVRDGQTKRAPIERVADVITSYFVPVVTLIVVVTWATWLALGLSGTLPGHYLDVEVGGWTVWSLQFAIAAFVVACPCGIGLAAPTALFVGSGLAAHYGILAKGGGEAFQEASHLDCIVFDKTGTLTQGGTPAITDHEWFLHADEDRRTVAGMVRSVEENSSHPLAKAMVGFCASRAADELSSPARVDERAGKGVEGIFELDGATSRGGHRVRVIVGNEGLLAGYDVDIPHGATRALDRWKSEAKSVILVAVEGLHASSATGPDTLGRMSWQLAAVFAASDPIRPEAARVVQAIRRRGIDVWMISGDNATTAHAVGEQVGIDREHIIAGVFPDEKSNKIQYLQRSLVADGSSSPPPQWRGILGRLRRRLCRRPRRQRRGRATVAMVGDGINDSPALTMADVGIAIGSGSDVAISSAKFVLVSSKLDSVLTLIDLSRAVFRRVLFNFCWAVVYNVIALPIAAGVLYPVRTPGSGTHIRLDPVWASLAMALSSISVVSSSLLLRSRMAVVGFRPRA